MASEADIIKLEMGLQKERLEKFWKEAEQKIESQRNRTNELQRTLETSYPKALQAIEVRLNELQKIEARLIELQRGGKRRTRRR